MQYGKVNVLVDQHAGSSGKGLMSTYLADRYGVSHVSSANFPNAGHTTVHGADKFIAKAIPTAGFLNRHAGAFHDVTGGMTLYITPGSGFDPARLVEEWLQCGKPAIAIHERASTVTAAHAAREREGVDSTKHLASTMQGSGAALADKLMRRQDVQLARDVRGLFEGTNIEVVTSMVFRDLVHGTLAMGQRWLHEGSQGYALSIDHGIEYPFTTSRNCGVQAAMDYLAVPPRLVGDVYMNLRTYPIRVGNIVEGGVEKGNSGGWYPDQEELTWDEVGRRAGMPDGVAANLLNTEKTTVTQRLRRVADFSWIGLRDAVRVNGATKLCVNFAQYLNWKDAGLKGHGNTTKALLSSETRAFVDRVEEETGVPVVLIGTGADHTEIIDLLD